MLIVNILKVYNLVVLAGFNASIHANLNKDTLILFSEKCRQIA